MRKRFVVALCTDLSGYTGLSQILDCEDLGSVMARVMGVVRCIVEDLGGVVEKYMGDAAVALFGLGRSREDDPVRAVLASERIHREVSIRFADLPVPLEMHSGIHAGEVVVGCGIPDGSTGGAIGMPITMACRLCDMAEAGEILVAGSLAPAISRFFRLEWLGLRTITGIQKPEHVYRVIGGRPCGIHVHRESGLTSPMVGRDRELSILLDIFRKSNEGVLTVCIKGEAGIGKSRLVRELERVLGRGAVFLAASCHEHARSIPYFPLGGLVDPVGGQVVRGALGGMSAGPIDAAARAVGGIIARAGTGDSAGGSSVREHITDALLGLLSELTSMAPTVICIEDVHWADRGTLDFLAFLARDSDALRRCLVVFTLRPGHRLGFSTTEIVLRDLEGADIARMVSHMTGGNRAGDQAVRWMVEASGGNPLFVEELVNYLVERGHDLSGGAGWSAPRGVPLTLRALVASRIDLLEPGPRRVLQEAALVGRTFTMSLVATITSHDRIGEALDVLEGHGFVKARMGGVYTFRHDVIREAASESLLKDDRRAVHERIVLALEKGHVDHASGTVDMLARHCLACGKYGKAVAYQMEAARRCMASGAWFEAGAWYEEARRVLEEHPDLPDGEIVVVDVLEGIWKCCRVLDPARARESLESLARRYHAASMSKEEAFAHIRLVNLHSQQGRFAMAFDAYERALDLMGQDEVLNAVASTVIAYTYTFLGRHNEALDLLAAARGVLERSDRFLSAVNALSTLAASVWIGDLSQAAAWYEKTTELGAGHLDIELMADMWLYHVKCLEGKFAEALSVHEKVASRERKLGRIAGGLSYLGIQGSIYFKSRYLGDIAGAKADLERFGQLSAAIEGGQALERLYRAWIDLEEGRASRARQLLEETVRVLDGGFANRVPYALTALAEAHLASGEAGEAERTARKCVERTVRNGNAEQLAWSLRLLAEAHMLSHAFKDASCALDEAYRVATTACMAPQQAWVLASRGKLARMCGLYEDAVRFSQTSVDLWGRMGNTYQARKTSRDCGLPEVRP